jgi:hypothetical protein
LEPNQDTLLEAMAAQRARYDAEQVLLAACQNDRGLYRDVLRQV